MLILRLFVISFIIAYLVFSICFFQNFGNKFFSILLIIVLSFLVLCSVFLLKDYTIYNKTLMPRTCMNSIKEKDHQEIINAFNKYKKLQVYEVKGSHIIVMFPIKNDKSTAILKNVFVKKYITLKNPKNHNIYLIYKHGIFYLER